MSRWQLPTQKGTTLWPNATRSPTKIVIEGVEAGTDLAREISKRLEGEIRQFHNAQAQNYSLGISENHQAQRIKPGLSMQYQNLQGQETIRVKVTEKVIKELSKKPKKPKPTRDMVRIEFVYDESPYADIEHSAYLVKPELARIADFFGTPCPGVARENSFSGTDDGSEEPAISYPPRNSAKARFEGAVIIDNTSEGHIHRSTLLIDLKAEAVRDEPVVIVDIYGRVTANPYLGAVCEQNLWGNARQLTDNINPEEVIRTWYTLTGFPEPFSFAPYSLQYPGDFYIPVEAAPELEDWRIDPVPESEQGFFYDPPTPTGTAPDLSYEMGEWPAMEANNGIVNISFINYYQNIDAPDIRRTAPSGNPLDRPGTTWNYDTNRTMLQSYSNDLEYQRLYAWDFATPELTVEAEVRAINIGRREPLDIVDYYYQEVIEGGNCNDYGLVTESIVWELEGQYPTQRGSQLLGRVTNTTEGSGGPVTTANRFDHKFLCRITYFREYDALTFSTELP